MNELGFLSWTGRGLNPLWLVVRNFGAKMEEKTHDGAHARTILAQGQLADHPKYATLLR